MSDSKREYTPIQALVIISLAIFISEALAMVILHYLSPTKRYIETILDSLFLIIILSPVIYLFIFRPMVHYVDKLKRDEEELKQRVDELERFQKATVQREFRMKELMEENEMLKKRIEEMEGKLGDRS
jgi:hypothetical protein